MTAYLTFTKHRAEQAARAAGTPLGVWLLWTGDERCDRAELTRRASGVHDTREAACAYAAAEGPAFVLCPDGEVMHVGRARDAGLDAAAATEETAYSERLRRMTFRDEVGPVRRR